MSNSSFFQENTQMAKIFMQSEENKRWINFFLLRSYKMAQTLSVSYNLKYVLAHSENFLDEFFNCLETELQAADEHEKLYNIQVLADLVINIVRLEPYAGYNYLLFYNIPFLFSRFLHKSKVFDLLLGLTVPSGMIFETTEDMSNRYWSYYKQSDFFPDLFATVSTNLKIDTFKMKSKYKPIRIPEMSKLMVGGTMPEKMKLRALTSATRTAFQTTKGLMVEDQKFISADIDLVKKYLKGIKAIIPMLNQNSKNSENSKANPKGRSLVRTGTLEMMPDENTIIQSIKTNMPINANYTVVFTSPEKLAMVEPFAIKKAENSELSVKGRKDSAKTNKTTVSRRSRLSVL